MIYRIFCAGNLLLVAIGLILISAIPAVAQDTKQADKHFNEYEFSLALEEYKQILEQNEPTLGVVQRIADIYRILNNTKEAEFWYAQVIAFPNVDPAIYYLYAEAAKRSGNYEKAKQLFLEYSRKAPGQEAMALQMAASCDTAMKWVHNPKPYSISKANTINSEGIDFSPFKTKEGVYFASDRLEPNKKKQAERDAWTGNGFFQMYFAAAKTDTTWGPAQRLPSAINTSFHNGPGVFHDKDQALYFTRTHAVRKDLNNTTADPTRWFQGGEGRTHINRLGIYVSKRKGSNWKKAKAFKYNNTAQYSVGHPAITKDGNILYFVSDMPGGFGETDIYYSERLPNGEWSTPVNAGNKINSKGRESFPTVGADGVLYFSSDGHMGMGGLDMFKAIGPHKAWTSVENLKYPLNTSHDDLGISVDESGKTGLLSSGRMDVNGYDDIFTFRETRLPCTVTGKTIEFVADKQNRGKRNEVVVGNVRLLVKEEGSDAEPVELYSDEKGRFTLPVFAGGKYTIRGSKPNYLTQTITVSPDCRITTDSLKVAMVFNRDTPNKPIVLENIYYDVDKYEITPQSAIELDKLVQTLKDNPAVKIELSSHTDSRQTNHYNQMLSELRAQAAVDYLVLKGINRNRLVAKGYGETQLLNQCVDGVKCPEEMHQENRRTEFKIIR